MNEIIESLERGEFPPCYTRNSGAFSVDEQLALARSRVVLAGLGGLGGHVLEHLLRAGVGAITACDPDIFEESNMNRQILATSATLGRGKAEAALARGKLLNPACDLRCHARTFEDGMLEGANLLIDALGGARDRAPLALAGKKRGLPIISAAVGGFTALISTCMPENGEPRKSLGEYMAGPEKSDANAPGMPSPVVALAASIQACEALNILCGRKPVLAGKVLLAEMTAMRFAVYNL